MESKSSSSIFFEIIAVLEYMIVFRMIDVWLLYGLERLGCSSSNFVVVLV